MEPVKGPDGSFFDPEIYNGFFKVNTPNLSAIPKNQVDFSVIAKLFPQASSGFGSLKDKVVSHELTPEEKFLKQKILETIGHLNATLTQVYHASTTREQATVDKAAAEWMQVKSNLEQLTNQLQQLRVKDALKHEFKDLSHTIESLDHLLKPSSPAFTADQAAKEVTDAMAKFKKLQGKKDKNFQLDVLLLSMEHILQRYGNEPKEFVNAARELAYRIREEQFRIVVAENPQTKSIYEKLTKTLHSNIRDSISLDRKLAIYKLISDLNIGSRIEYLSNQKSSDNGIRDLKDFFNGLVKGYFLGQADINQLRFVILRLPEIVNYNKLHKEPFDLNVFYQATDFQGLARARALDPVEFKNHADSLIQQRSLLAGKNLDISEDTLQGIQGPVKVTHQFAADLPRFTRLTVNDKLLYIKDGGIQDVRMPEAGILFERTAIELKVPPDVLNIIGRITNQAITSEIWRYLLTVTNIPTITSPTKQYSSIERSGDMIIITWKASFAVKDPSGETENLIGYIGAKRTSRIHLRDLDPSLWRENVDLNQAARSLEVADVYSGFVLTPEEAMNL